MHPSLICDHILRSCINITPFCSLLRIYQLFYAVITVTYKEKHCKNNKTVSKSDGVRGPWGVYQYVYIHKHTEVVF
jgi:hypothetical protein